MAFDLPNTPLKNLRRWFQEDWRTPSGSKTYTKGDSGIFRPTRKVSSKTPKTYSELSDADIAKAKKERRTRGRVSRYGGKKKDKKNK
jgi:hypothetical protein|tara:strand:- start:77 stop:337 length:261 start_codon:yes stop_codon:yes gene_type:complete